MVGCGTKLRVLALSIILGIWLFIADVLNYSINFNEKLQLEPWAKVLIIISGIIFSLVTVPGAILVLINYRVKSGALAIITGCFVGGVIRLVATLVGFRDFWQASNLDSTTAGTSDIAIACLQLFLVFDAWYLCRKVGKDKYAGIGEDSKNSKYSIDDEDSDAVEREEVQMYGDNDHFNYGQSQREDKSANVKKSSATKKKKKKRKKKKKKKQKNKTGTHQPSNNNNMENTLYSNNAYTEQSSINMNNRNDPAQDRTSFHYSGGMGAYS